MNAPLIKRNSILVVDDNPQNIDLLINILEPEGYNLAFADSGEACLELINRVNPDLILLDIQMPGIGGIETCARIKQIPQYEAIPVIFVTAMTEEEYLEKAFSVGGVDYITKPIRKTEVKSRVYNHLKMRSLFQFQQHMIKALEDKLDLATSSYADFGESLRSPLNVIMGYSDLMKEDAIKKGMEDFAKGQAAIENACEQMKGLLNNLLYVARLDAEKVSVIHEEFTINSLLKATESHAIDCHKEQRNKLRVVPLEQDKILYQDSQKILKILGYLVENSLKFTNNGIVEVTCIPDDDYVIFQIKDTGRGFRYRFDLTPLEEVLGRFPVGKGLGLRLCTKLTQLIHGDLTLTSSPDSGSKFRLRVPLVTDPDTMEP